MGWWRRWFRRNHHIPDIGFAFTSAFATGAFVVLMCCLVGSVRKWDRGKKRAGRNPGSWRRLKETFEELGHLPIVILELYGVEINLGGGNSLLTEPMLNPDRGSFGLGHHDRA
jgi:hypothetical protein